MFFHEITSVLYLRFIQGVCRLGVIRRDSGRGMEKSDYPGTLAPAEFGRG